MISAAMDQPKAGEVSLLDRTTRLMGGARVLGRRIATEMQAHEAVEKGLPSAALHHLVGHLAVIDVDTSLEKGIGLSRRTYQRTKETPKRLLSTDQSGRMWRFAHVLALATDVLGSQQAAEEWLATPAPALNQRRPIDLLSTPAGAEMVESLLRRIDYGVYT